MAELDAPLQKLVSYTDTLKGKITKLTEENAKLKTAHQALKSTTGRVRKIPKKEGDENPDLAG